MSQKPNWLTSHGTPWRPGEARLVYENPWISVSEHQAVAPTGRPALYGVVRFKNLAIGVLPIHDDGTIVLVGQHRFAHGAYSWEIPGAADRWASIRSTPPSASCARRPG